jgi:multidrug resistance efflux pump
MSQIFRKEALEALQASEEEGDLVRLMPRWTTATYWLVVALVVAGIAYSTSATVSEFAQGPAVVRVEGRLDLTTPMGGVVAAVHVQAGERVSAGQLLVQFQSLPETQELEHIERELEQQLVKVLLRPGDEGARQSISSLQATRELALKRVRERSVVAPRAGRVSNLRIRPGQMLAPGDTVATLIDEQSAFSVVALVPGQFRPMLRRGMMLRLQLEGYPHVYRDLPIESVGDEVVGPTEVRRYLGQELYDTVPVQGSLVLVRARLTDEAFNFEGKSYRYYDGIQGRVDIRVRSLRLLVMIFPVFRGVLGNGV